MPCLFKEYVDFPTFEISLSAPNSVRVNKEQKSDHLDSISMSPTYLLTQPTHLEIRRFFIAHFCQHVRQQNYKLSQRYGQHAQDHGHVTQVFRHITSNNVRISGQHAQVSGTVDID